MSRYLRYLRIAFSVVCGIICLLLIELWVQSYGRRDLVSFTPTGSRGYLMMTAEGELRFGKVTTRKSGWDWHTWSNSTRKHEIQVPSVLGFSWAVARNRAVLVVPCWFPVLLSGSFAAVFLKGHTLRFSLRTLLIAVTLVAVVLGAIVYASR